MRYLLTITLLLITTTAIAQDTYYSVASNGLEHSFSYQFYPTDVIGSAIEFHAHDQMMFGGQIQVRPFTLAEKVFRSFDTDVYFGFRFKMSTEKNVRVSGIAGIRFDLLHRVFVAPYVDSHGSVYGSIGVKL